MYEFTKIPFSVNEQNTEEEYILAMRTTAYNRDVSDEMWRHRRSKPLEPGQPLIAQRKKTRAKSLIPMTDDHTAKVLASLVPDEIIYNVNDYSNRPYDVCLLFGDVSGRLFSFVKKTTLAIFANLDIVSV